MKQKKLCTHMWRLLKHVCKHIFFCYLSMFTLHPMNFEIIKQKQGGKINPRSGISIYMTEGYQDKLARTEANRCRISFLPKA